MSATDTAEAPPLGRFEPSSARPLPPSAPTPAPPAGTGSGPAMARSRSMLPRTSRVLLRRVDPWSVLKLSLVFYLSGCVILLTAGVLLWAAANSVGAIGNIESFMESIGFEDFQFRGGQILRGMALASVVFAIAGTFANVLMSIMYNLMSEVVGGLKLTLAEDAPTTRI